MNLLNIYNSCKKHVPFGLSNRVFSVLFCLKAPYFRSISPLVEKLEEGRADVSMRQSWKVQNHIKTVHAIAVCNLVEMTMGCVAESTIPGNLRWLPRGMDVNYVAKATGKLTDALCMLPFAIPRAYAVPSSARTVLLVDGGWSVLVIEVDFSNVNLDCIDPAKWAHYCPSRMRHAMALSI